NVTVAAVVDGVTGIEATKQVTVQAPPPKAPQNLNAVFTDGSLVITWNAVAEASGYTVTVNGHVSQVTGTEHIEENVGYGTFNISVTATAHGTTGAAASIVIEVVAPEAPAAPKNVIATFFQEED